MSDVLSSQEHWIGTFSFALVPISLSRPSHNNIDLVNLTSSSPSSRYLQSFVQAALARFVKRAPASAQDRRQALQVTVLASLLFPQDLFTSDQLPIALGSASAPIVLPALQLFAGAGAVASNANLIELSEAVLSYLASVSRLLRHQCDSDLPHSSTCMDQGFAEDPGPSIALLERISVLGVMSWRTWGGKRGDGLVRATAAAMAPQLNLRL